MFKEKIILVLSILFWLQVMVVIFLGIRLLSGRQPGQTPAGVKTPAMIRNKI